MGLTIRRFPHPWCTAHSGRLPTDPVKKTRRLFASVLLAVGFVTSVAWFSRDAEYPGWRSDPPSQPAHEWPTPDGFTGNHYSVLGDITPDNVRHLEVAWVHRTGDVTQGREGEASSAFQSTPVMVDGILHVVTPFSRALALDPESGEELWSFDPHIDRSDSIQGKVTMRGHSVWTDSLAIPGEQCAQRVFLATFDSRLFSLDALSGQPCEGFGNKGWLDLGADVARIEGRRGQYKQTAPPAILRDVVVVGSSIFDNRFADASSGVVRGFNVRTGALLWSWEPLLGMPHNPENGTQLPPGAGNAWATLTADEENDLVFVPTGSPSPDHYGVWRPGDNLYANSLVALRGTTGEVVWHYQMVHHDLWDYDLPSPPLLFTLYRDGVEIPAVVQSTKMGYLFFFHRITGELLFPVEERPVPASDVPGEEAWPTQPVPVLPAPLHAEALTPEDAWGLTPLDRRSCRRRIEAVRSEGIFTPPSLQGSIAFPSFFGGMEWGGLAYDPSLGLLVTNTNRAANILTLVPAEEAEDAVTTLTRGGLLDRQVPTPYAVKRELLWSPIGLPCIKPPWGLLHAIDVRSGQLHWEIPLGGLSDLAKGLPTPPSWGSASLGGPLIAGGLVFIAGTLDSRIRAFDLETGELLWSDKLPAGGQATPMTYRAHAGGRQYVVINAGGHGDLQTRLGDYVVAYALPVNSREAAPGRE